MKKYKHWHLQQDEKTIFWIGFDRADRDVNTVNEAVLNELNDIVDNLSKSNTAGLVIYSLKKKGFIAGADIYEFSQFDESKAASFIQLGQKIFDKLANLSVPTVAMMEGFCLGGGAELALACRYRVLANTEASCIGLPEVRIGIIPGWGGMKRLPKLIGSFQALTRLLLTGKNIYAKEALKLGLVDAVVPVRQLRRATEDFINGSIGGKKLYPEKPCKINLYSYPFSRQILAYILQKKLKKQINPEHYPAPYALLDYWKNNEKNTETNIIRTLMTPHGTARELLRVFQLKERLKNQVIKDNKPEKSVRHVHVVGAGVMGGDIAAWCVFRGLKVTLQDENDEALGKAMLRAVHYFKKQYRLPHELQAAYDRLIPDKSGKGIAKADVIIEAIVENLEAKQAFFKKAEAMAKPEALLATNTSSLSIEAIAKVLKNPERLIGIHFFNPATKMELVEVVKNDRIINEKESFTELFTQTLAFVVQIGKLPIPVKDSPGFLVNRILMPYLMECMMLLDEGVKPVEIDEAATGFGMIMGPVELADTIGLDICLSVAQNLANHKIPLELQEKVKLGFLGKKTGRGFFCYDKRDRKKTRLSKENESGSKPDQKKMADRLVMRIIHEAEICLSEKVVADKDLLDAAMIFGTGFAPFRGGPMQYAEYR